MGHAPENRGFGNIAMPFAEQLPKPQRHESLFPARRPRTRLPPHQPRPDRAGGRSAHGGRRNVMAAAWSMPVEFMPPRIAMVIDKQHLHARAGQRQRRFGICIPGVALSTDLHRRQRVGPRRPTSSRATASSDARRRSACPCRDRLRRLARVPADPRAARARRLRHLLRRSARQQPIRGCSSRAAGRSATTTPSCRPCITWVQATSPTPVARFRPRR